MTPTGPAVDDTVLATAARHWLEVGLSTEPTDRTGAEAAVRVAYAAAGLAEPEQFIWCGSPWAGVLAAAALVGAGTAGAGVRSQVRTRPWATARSALTRQLGPAGWSRHWAASGGRTWPLIADRLVTPLRTRLEAELPADQPGARFALLDAVLGHHDAAWLAAFDPGSEDFDGVDQRGTFDGVDQRGTFDGVDQRSTFDGVDQRGSFPELAGLAGVARSAGWWWPYERVVVLTDRPTALHRDNLGRLHHGDGPALSYPDGWGLHAWRGMPIPADLAGRLADLTVAQIQAEDNAEVRRVMLEHFGFDRYLREAKATRIQTDDYGQLWSLRIPGDEPLVMVEVVNSTPEPDGTRRTYFLRVPPSIRTARAGVAWTFDLTEEEYAPLVQT